MNTIEVPGTGRTLIHNSDLQYFKFQASQLKEMYELQDKMTSQMAELIREKADICVLPVDLETYQWENKIRRENEEVRKYNRATVGVAKGDIRLNEDASDGYVVCLFNEYGLRIEGM
jgi:hypothetical protein